MNRAVYIGCAGWSIPASAADQFPKVGSVLERYSQRFNCVEINSSFYRSHLPSTYVRWADSVPAQFRFSVKMPRTITHQARLVGTEALVEKFIDEVSNLGEKLGCILIQLPPSLAFDTSVAQPFVRTLRQCYPGMLTIEARHSSWFCPEADVLLSAQDISRVRADPAVAKIRQHEEGDVRYFRYHGSPKMYYSDYSLQRLTTLSEQISAIEKTVWCIFDNTALGAATFNATTLGELLGIV